MAEQILQPIAELQLQPGDRMPTEIELASRLGTSRTVAREAVKILSAIRRVRAQKGRGLYVTDDEGACWAPRAGEASSCRPFDRGDDDFHVGIAIASRNPFLVSAVREARRLQRQSSTIGLHGTVGGHAAEAVEEHAAIRHAIRDGEPEVAARAATIHLDNTREDYRREIQRRVFG